MNVLGRGGTRGQAWRESWFVGGGFGRRRSGADVANVESIDAILDGKRHG